MSEEIRLYKQLTTIQTYDWEIMTEISIDNMQKLLDSEWKFIRIWNEIIAKTQIKKVFIRQIWGIESFILSKPKDIQEILRTREKQKKEKVGRWFDNIQEIHNYLKEKEVEA